MPRSDKNKKFKSTEIPQGLGESICHAKLRGGVQNPAPT